MANGASGVIYYAVNLDNVSSAGCATGGYFGAAAYDPAGALIVGTETRDPSLGAGTPTVMIPLGGTVSFKVGLPDNDGGGGDSCPTTMGDLHLTPPNDTGQIDVATPRQGGGFPTLCQQQLLVGPVTSGSRP